MSNVHASGLQGGRTAIYFNALHYQGAGLDIRVERLATRVKYIVFMLSGGRKKQVPLSSVT